MRGDVALSKALGMALMLSACSPTPRSSPSSSSLPRSSSDSVPSAQNGPQAESSQKASAAPSPPVAGSALTVHDGSGSSSKSPRSSLGHVPSAGGSPRAQSPQPGSATPSPTAAGNASLPPSAAASASTAIPSSSNSSAAEGKKLFVAKCIVCHKADGSGGVKLTGNATPDWRNPNLMTLPAHNDAALRDCITNGKPKSGMLAWGKSGQLKPSQVEDLIAYIHTFSMKK
jgi:mono/diheme cytochrome c family protein